MVSNYQENHKEHGHNYRNMNKKMESLKFGLRLKFNGSTEQLDNQTHNVTSTPLHFSPTVVLAWQTFKTLFSIFFFEAEVVGIIDH